MSITQKLVATEIARNVLIVANYYYNFIILLTLVAFHFLFIYVLFLL